MRASCPARLGRVAQAGPSVGFRRRHRAKEQLIRITLRAVLASLVVVGCVASVAAVMVSSFGAATLDIRSSLAGIALFMFLLAVTALLVVSFRQRVSWAAIGAPRSAPKYDPRAIDDVSPARGRGTSEKRRVTVGSLDFLLNALLDPTNVFGRVNESVELFSRSVRVTSRFTVDLESAVTGAQSPRVFFVPLHLAKKPANRDLLLDGLRIEGPEGQRRSTLDARHQHSLLTALVRSLVRASGSTVALDVYLSAPDPLEEEVWKVICATSAPSSGAVDALTNRIQNLDPAAPRPDMFAYAAELVVLLAAARPIIVPVHRSETGKQWPPHVRLLMQRRLVPRVTSGPLAGGASRLSRADSALRLALGISPTRMTYDIEQAGRTRSYHLEFVCPAGTYCEGVDRGVVRRGRRPLSGEVTLQPLQGQRRAHLHVAGHEGGDLLYTATFAERSPGSFASASLVTSAAAVVLWLAATRGPGSSLAQVLPALFAVPAAVATLVGIEGTRSERRATLLSRLLVIGTVVLTLAGYIVIVSVPDATALIRREWLTLLASLATVASAVAVLTWGVKAAVENAFRARVPDEEGD